MKNMGKIPYVLECELFMRCEFAHAEELLADYNDFYEYNFAQYGHIYDKDVIDDNISDAGEEIDEIKRKELAEHNAKVATDHFANLFGSKDFGECTLMGLKFEWYALQKILLEEYKYKTHIKESAMNEIAPMLRNVASTVLFAERVVAGLEKLSAAPEIIEPIKEGFELLLERCATEKFVLPEYRKTKVQFNKFKKAEHYLEFCNKLFFGDGE